MDLIHDTEITFEGNMLSSSNNIHVLVKSVCTSPPPLPTAFLATVSPTKAEKQPESCSTWSDLDLGYICSAPSMRNYLRKLIHEIIRKYTIRTVCGKVLLTAEKCVLQKKTSNNFCECQKSLQEDLKNKFEHKNISWMEIN